MHGYSSEKTRLNIDFEEKIKQDTIENFFKNHTRIAVAILGLILASGTYLIFDPLRAFFVKNNITGKFTMRVCCFWLFLC